MVETIQATRYVAEDGTDFNSYEEASAYEASVAFRELYEQTVHEALKQYGLSCSSIYDWLYKHWDTVSIIMQRAKAPESKDIEPWPNSKT